MNLYDFEIEFKRLREKWPRFYTKEMESDIFILLEHCDLHEFHRFVGAQLWRKIGDPPIYGEFKDFARKRTGSEQGEGETQYEECSDCDGRGNFIALDMRTVAGCGYAAETWFACISCPNGKTQARKMASRVNRQDYNPFWNPRWLDHGYALMPKPAPTANHFKSLRDSFKLKKIDDAIKPSPLTLIDGDQS